MVMDRAYQPPQIRPVDLACHHLETISQEKTTTGTSQAVEKRPGLILERCDLAEDSRDRPTWRRHAEAFAQPQLARYGFLMMVMISLLV